MEKIMIKKTQTHSILDILDFEDTTVSSIVYGVLIAINVSRLNVKKYKPKLKINFWVQKHHRIMLATRTLPQKQPHGRRSETGSDSGGDDRHSEPQTE